MNSIKFSHIAASIVRAIALITFLLAASNCLAATPENIHSPKAIRVVMDDNYPPYVFRDDQGRLQGIIVDQWGLWEKKTGIHVEITGMDWGEAQRRMQAGEFDVIDTIFRNEKREGLYDFSKPYAQLDVPLFFHEDISGIRGPDDLKGFLVAVKAGDSAIDILKKHGVTNIAEYPSYEKLIEAARDGKAKVFTVDRPPALYFLNKMGIQNRFRETKPLYHGDFHRAVLKGQSNLLSLVENGFAKISKADYEAIDKRWMGTSLAATPYLRYALYCIGAIAVLALVLMVWLCLVKRAVSQKTHELAMSGERHRSILQTAMSGIWLADTEGRLLEVNKSYCQMSGYSEQELLKMSISDLEANDSVDGITNRIRLIIERGEAHFESRYRRKDGTVFDVEVSVQYQPAYGGLCVGFLQDISERKHAEEISRLNEARLRSLVNILQRPAETIQGFLDTALNEAIKLTESSYGYIFFYNEDCQEFEQKCWSKDVMRECAVVNRQLVYSLDKIGFWGEAVRQRKPIILNDFKAENPLRRGYPEGHVHLSKFMTVPIFSNDKIVAVVGVANKKSDYVEENILQLTLLMDSVWKYVENKRGEIALQQERDRAQSYLDTVETMIVALDEEGKITTINRKACQIMGYREDELVGQFWFNTCLPKPDGMEIVYPYFLEIMAGKQERPENRENPIVTRRGDLRQIAWHNAVLRDEQGRIIGTLSAGEDITERKRAEEALRSSEAKFSAIFRTSPDSIIITRLEDAVFVDVNEGFTALLGYSAEEVIGKSSTSVGIWVEPEDMARLAHQHKEQGSVNNLEARLRRKDGSLLTALVSSRLIELDGDLCTLNIARDITDRDKLQMEHLKMQKLESLGILAGGIAHDFNNILTGIMGNISFAQMFLDATHKAYKPLEAAEKASLRARELAQQLLTFAKGGEPIKKVVTAQRMVEESVSFVLRGSNVKASIDIPDSIHAIEADEGQISQAFNNIIINATQAMPGGGILTITAQNETLIDSNLLSLPAGTYVKFSFADQGCGISDADLKNIFDPYFTTKAAGSGLGLASVYSIVKRHNGNISATSKVGQGTFFTIYLPSIGKSYYSYQANSTMVAVSAHTGGSILVMDDEEIIRELAAEMLEEIGYQVTTCDNGTEAIARYRAAKESGAPFSAVIMDLTIPGGMSGKEAAEEILAIDPAARLIVSSGYSNDPVMSAYSTYGFAGAIAKPYNVSELAQLLSSLLSIVR